MSKRSSGSWRWTRAVARADAAIWTARLETRGRTDWLLIEKPGRLRLVLEVFARDRREAQALVENWGGRIALAPVQASTPQAEGRPIRISPALRLVHRATGKISPAGDLVIPFGLAFGSGEHATTLMLLRALGRHGKWEETRLLDLGTGSGVLALAARKLGCRTIVATDFDPAAIRTARANEALNFSTPLVRWRRADVLRLRPERGWTLITANLFSGILVAAAPPIAAALRPGGQLWLSGVLRPQQHEVAAAYRAAGLRALATTTRGKWVMQQWTK